MLKTQTVKQRLKDSRGFSLIEAVAVLIILGVIAVVAISRAMSTDEVQLISEMNTLKGHLRFAQYKALNDLPGTKWGINVAGSSYTLVKVDSSGTTNPLTLPGETSYTHNFDGGVTASVSTGTNPVLFDEWGNPGEAKILTMGTQTINIENETGFIP